MRELYATIDLGSNSFHLLIAALVHDELKILESTSDKVMLAEGLSKQLGITSQAMQRGMSCLKRFAQRLENIPQTNIRIVATNTLRSAVNSDHYILQLESMLGGIRIDVVSGIEEARLIYLGVNHSWSSLNNQKMNLVVDIGGGSTEFIVGQDFKLKRAESLPMGCVAYRRYFVNGTIDRQNFSNAINAAKFELANIKKHFSQRSWEQVIGSAGTFKAIEKILVEQQLTQEGINLSGLIQLKEQLLTFSNISELDIIGLKADRKSTISSGIAIALAIFESLGIKQLQLARGGLREGILYDLLGRHKSEDVRLRSINAICRRYKVSKQWRNLNKKISKHLVNSTQSTNCNVLSEQSLKFLEWATQSFRIGLAINHSQYQVHSAYLVEHSELSGFSILERKLLAALLKNHRSKIDLKLFDDKLLIDGELWQFTVIVFLLRLTVIIGQNGRVNNVDSLSIEINYREFVVHVAGEWLKKNSLIQHAIEQEQKYWYKTGVQFRLSIRNH